MRVFEYATAVDAFASLSSIGEQFAEFRKFTLQSMHGFKPAVGLFQLTLRCLSQIFLG